MPRADRRVPQILGVTDDFVAVNKPACVPVHTVGQYRKNTVMGIVQVRVWPCVRCVRPGVMELWKSCRAACCAKDIARRGLPVLTEWDVRVAGTMRAIEVGWAGRRVLGDVIQAGLPMGADGMHQFAC